ncbi:peptidoglycan-binding domain-containing protein [Dinoroseobacter shibae]|uniref:peptidoglycan-binding domain-containing protein n=1 Tax=Dinoroseobacter shibae TaxID=215813 RepID=UPI00031329BE|nr:peptidoglycan-binding domain-containing protein [Dinoroseobacter shibae]URF47576.1 peptidoglycan-binding protein [Dinoroseobacter shibae]URF51886.1 peptidoglycan-binding protein [Dinoroseobacter shibae]
MQSALNAFGFPAGVVDGDLGPRSRAAIGAYQAFMGFPGTGFLDEYQKGVLLNAHRRLQAGDGAAFPNVLAAEGTKGLLKAFTPTVGPSTYPDPQVAQGGRIGAPGAPFGGPEDLGVVPDLPVAVPSLPQAGPTATRMSERCEFVALTTRINQGLIQADAMLDADQALSEQFCEARSFALAAGQSYAVQIGFEEAQLVEICTRISAALGPVRAMMAGQSAQAVQARVVELGASLGMANLPKLAAYGKLCTAQGYRLDDAEIALSGALLSFAAGQRPHAELLAHHAREGFGLAAQGAAAFSWYDIALDALERGATPAFLPSKSAQRVAVMRAAIKSGQLQADTVGAVPMVPASGGGIPDLPLPQ